jgi:hypothetical protein
METVFAMSLAESLPMNVLRLFRKLDGAVPNLKTILIRFAVTCKKHLETHLYVDKTIHNSALNCIRSKFHWLYVRSSNKPVDCKHLSTFHIFIDSSSLRLILSFDVHHRCHRPSD